MDGCVDNKNRILNEWYKILIKNRKNITDEDNKYWENLRNIDFPDGYQKNWKYFPLKDFLKYHFVSEKKTEFNFNKYKKFILDINANKLIFINGVFSNALSDNSIDPWILKITKNIDQNKKFCPIKPNIFTYLSRYLSNSIISFTLPSKKKVKKPLYLIYIVEGSNFSNCLITSNHCHSINIENHSTAHVIEHFISINQFNQFYGTYTSTVVGHNAILNHTQLKSENCSSYYISQHDFYIGKNSDFQSNMFSIFGSKCIWDQINTQVNHSTSSISLNSLMLLTNENYGKIQTYLEHNNKNYAFSRQLHKIIGCKKSTGIFNGLIKVNKKSANTDSKMINKNLLFNKSAKINTTPKLEIYSDDVQCSHGATIGAIDANHLFYLTSRGISKKQSLKLLISAFSIEIVDMIQNIEIKNFILEKINQALTDDIYENLSN